MMDLQVQHLVQQGLREVKGLMAVSEQPGHKGQQVMMGHWEQTVILVV
jgi:hypothetical protein